jgi:hypothetical protein
MTYLGLCEILAQPAGVADGNGIAFSPGSGRGAGRKK